MGDSNMTSNKPYLIRAFYEWIVDNDLTPFILVDTSFQNVTVPERYIENNRITLNVTPRAVSNLVLGNDSVGFSARFNGQSMMVEFPVVSVLAVYARENGQGMMFPTEATAAEEMTITTDEDSVPNQSPPPSSDNVHPIGKKGKPTLTVVK